MRSSETRPNEVAATSAQIVTRVISKRDSRTKTALQFLPAVVGLLASVSAHATEVTARPHAVLTAGFIRNDGQWPSEIRFATLGQSTNVIACEQEVRLRFAAPGGSNGRGEIAIEIPERVDSLVVVGVGAESVSHHFFKGDDPADWRTHVPSFARIDYQDVVAGVDLTLHSPRGDSAVTYDLLCSEESRIDDLVLRVTGASRLELDSLGNLVIHSHGISLTQTAPHAFMLTNSGERRSIGSAFRLIDSTSFGFTVVSPSPGETVVVDPEIILSESLGHGVFACDTQAVAEDLNGNIVIAGITDDPSFPISPGAYDSTLNPSSAPIYPYDIFVSVLSVTENKLIHSTYVGGISSESIADVSIQSNGDIIATGMTLSADFPTTPGSLQTTAKGLSDAFAIAMPATCDQLRFSTRLGGAGAELASGSTISTSGDIVFAGQTGSLNFPVTPGCFASQKASGSPDLFVSRISADGTQLIASTYIGGTSVESGGDFAGDVALCANEDVILAGYTSGFDYPTTPGSFQPINPSGIIGGSGIVVTRFSPDLSTLVASTYLGTTNSFGIVQAIAIDSQDRPVLSGKVNGDDFLITPGAYEMPEYLDPLLHDGMFITRMLPDLSALSYSTQLLSKDDSSSDLVIDGLDCAFLGGTSQHYYHPVTDGCYDSELNLGNPVAGDGFVMRVAPDGRDLWYSTYLGGWGYETLNCISLTRAGDVLVGGVGASYGFPDTIAPFPKRTDSLFAATATRMSLLPKGTDRFGHSTLGSGGYPVIGVTRMPSVRPGEFGLTCYGAPKSATGWLVLSPKSTTSPLRLGNIDLFLDGNGLITVPVLASPTGALILAGNLSRIRPSTKFYAQFVFAEPTASGTLSASAALEIVVQE